MSILFLVLLPLFWRSFESSVFFLRFFHSEVQIYIGPIWLHSQSTEEKKTLIFFFQQLNSLLAAIQHYLNTIYFMLLSASLFFALFFSLHKSATWFSYWSVKNSHLAKWMSFNDICLFYMWSVVAHTAHITICCLVFLIVRHLVKW